MVCVQRYDILPLCQATRSLSLQYPKTAGADIDEVLLKKMMIRNQTHQKE
jgi:hypothetical protein